MASPARFSVETAAADTSRLCAPLPQYDVELLQRIEGVVGKKMTEFPHDKQAIAILAERVGEASREAIKEMKEQEADGGRHQKGRKRGQSERDDMDGLEELEEEGGGASAGGKRKGKGLSKSKRRR